MEEELFIKEEGVYEIGSGGVEEEVEDLLVFSVVYVVEFWFFKCLVCEKIYKDLVMLW